MTTEHSSHVAISATSAVNLFNYKTIEGDVNLSNGANNVTLGAGSEIKGNFNIGTGNSTLTLTDGLKGSPLLTKSPVIISGSNSIANIGNKTATIKVDTSGLSPKDTSIVLIKATAAKQINCTPYNSFFDKDSYRFTFKVENKQLIAAISPVIFDLIYNLNGGERGGNTANVTVEKLLQGTYNLDLTDVTHGLDSGWNVLFLGWTSDSVALGKIYGSGDKVPTMTNKATISNADVTVYALWSYDKNSNGIPDVNEKEYTLTYNPNGGELTGSTDSVKVVDKLLPNKYTLNPPAVTHGKNSGWNVLLMGWTSDSVAIGKIYGSGDKVPTMPNEVTISNANVTVYAVWSYDKNNNGKPDVYESEYTLTYNLNGGARGGNTGNVTVGKLLPDTYTLDLTGVTHGKKDKWDVLFIGWTLDAGTLGQIYGSGDTVPVRPNNVTISNANMTVYAVWSYDKNGNGIPDTSESEHSIIYNLNGGNQNGKPGDITEGNKLPGAYLLNQTVDHDKVIQGADKWAVLFLGWTLDSSTYRKRKGRSSRDPKGTHRP
ncbi:MAG: InlB B-repeat-containing protein, partial [Candidatus Methanoplasma sp.]|nr:InlB B-repeat-containing protein [Candidatus Methanoplasma sp.]